MSQYDDCFADVNSVPTRVLHYGTNRVSTEKAWKVVDPIIILFISGNPGEVAYYSDLMATINASTRIPVIGLSQAGHNVIPKDRSFPSISENKDLYSLEGQIYHKKCFIDQFISCQSRLILMGHSIGTYIILELLDRYDYIKSKVLHSILIFPTIESMGETSEGKKCQFLFGWFKYPLLALAYLLDLLSDNCKRMLVSLIFNGSPECAIKSATNLMNPNCLMALIHMSLIEFQTVNELNKEAITANTDRLTFFFGETDKWCPVEYVHRIINAFPESDMRLCLGTIDHAFPLYKEATDQITKLVIETIESVVHNNNIKTKE